MEHGCSESTINLYGTNDMNKSEHIKWLAKRGLTRSQVKDKRTQLGNPNTIPDYSTTNSVSLSNTIPSNGTKSADISKSQFSKKNHTTAPAYNKGPVMVISKEDIRYAGKK